MKRALEWIKSNPFNVTAGAVALLGLVALIYIYFILAPGSTTTKSEELQQFKSQQDMILAAQVLLPNEDPNAPPNSYNVVINQQVITQVSGIYDTIRNQRTQIINDTQNANSQRHADYLLGGTAIWGANKRPAASLRTQAAADYIAHHQVLFKHNAPERWNMPYFAVGNAPTPEEIDLLLEESATSFLGRIGQTSAGSLNQEQAQQLFSTQREKLMELLTGRARDINFYVTLPPEDDRFLPELDDDANPGSQPVRTAPIGLEGGGFGGGFGTPSGGTDTTFAGYPFPIAAWATATTDPSIDELWEGQVQLWILRDVMWAIHNTCAIPGYDSTYYTSAAPAPRVPGDSRTPQERMGLVRVDYDPDTGKPLAPSPYCVINSPIKRLLVLETLPGYVGLHNEGATMMVTEESQFGGGTERSQFILATQSMGRDSGGFGGIDTGGTETESIYPTPPASLVPQDQAIEIRDNFGITPTGRVSNSVFDVRHSRLVVDIEWSQLPAFMNELREVNFMTVLSVNVEDIDEYQMLREGYVYGSGDVVRAELIIESLWFREWTQPLMPEIVKDQLLINGVQEDPNAAAEQFGPGGAPPF